MRLLAIERKHIAPVPSGEREEARQIFGLKGFSGGELERIVDVIMSDEDRWAQTMAVEEFRLSLIVKSPILAALSTSVLALRPRAVCQLGLDAVGVRDVVDRDERGPRNQLSR